MISMFTESFMGGCLESALRRLFAVLSRDLVRPQWDGTAGANPPPVRWFLSSGPPLVWESVAAVGLYGFLHLNSA